MSDIKDTAKTIQSQRRSWFKEPYTYLGKIIAVNGNIWVPGRPNYIYVSPFDRQESITSVLNRTIIDPIDGMWVDVGVPIGSTRPEVLGPSQSIYARSTSGTSPTIPGSTWINSSDIPGIMVVSISGTSINLSPLNWYDDSGLINTYPGGYIDLATYWSGLATSDMKPVTVYLDKSDNTVKSSAGSAVVNLPSTNPTYPAITNYTIPVCVVLVRGNASVLDAKDVVDAREIFGPTSVDIAAVSSPTFIGLPDTPAAYATHALELLHINSTPDAVDFSGVTSTDVSSNTAARHTHSNQAQLDLVTDGDHDVIVSGNPHSVTYTEVGAAAASHTHVEADVTDLDHDAVKLQGRNVASTAPTDTYALVWNDGAAQWEPQAQAGGGGTFLSHSDTPASYSGQSGQIVAVNSGETALEFISPSSSSLNQSIENTAPDFTLKDTDTSGTSMYAGFKMVDASSVLQAYLRLTGGMVILYSDGTSISLQAAGAERARARSGGFDVYGDFSVRSNVPILDIRDDDASATNAAQGRFRFLDSAAALRGYVGMNASTDTIMNIANLKYVSATTAAIMRFRLANTSGTDGSYMELATTYLTLASGVKFGNLFTTPQHDYKFTQRQWTADASSQHNVGFSSSANPWSAPASSGWTVVTTAGGGSGTPTVRSDLDSSWLTIYAANNQATNNPPGIKWSHPSTSTYTILEAIFSVGHEWSGGAVWNGGIRLFEDETVVSTSRWVELRFIYSGGTGQMWFQVYRYQSSDAATYAQTTGYELTGASEWWICPEGMPLHLKMTVTDNGTDADIEIIVKGAESPGQAMNMKVTADSNLPQLVGSARFYAANTGRLWVDEVRFS